MTFFGPDSARIAGALVARLDRDGRLLVLHAGPAETRRVTSLDVATLVAGFVATNAQRADAEAAAVAAHVEIALPAAALERFVGEYPLTANGVVTIPFVITRDGDKLFMRVADRPREQLFAESPTRFFMKTVNGQVEFETDATGNAVALTVTVNGTRQRALKTK